MAHTDRCGKEGLWNGAALFLFPGLCGTSVASISAHGSARIEDLNAFDFALQETNGRYSSAGPDFALYAAERSTGVEALHSQLQAAFST
jgi:hypothetical protein